jgi:hypothetical protein
LVLKPFSTSWTEAGIEDYITNSLAAQLSINSIAIKPVVLYLNGEYWGIYFLQERIDEYYFEDNFSVNKDSVYTSWDGKGNFSSVSNYIEDHDLSETQHYDVISNLIDIDNFIDYQLFEIFIANNDWPANNVKYWRPSMDGEKWQWIFFDGDAGLRKIDFDGFAQALNNTPEGETFGTNDRATILLRKLLENDNFKTAFLNRLEFLLENQFDYSNTHQTYQNVISLISDEVHNQNERFAKPSNYVEWEKAVNNCNDFLALRACEISHLVTDRFNRTIEKDDCNIASFIIEDFSIIPNPNNGIFSVQFNSSISTPGQLIISNSLGQFLKVQNQVIVKGNNTIPFSNLDLPSGILFVNLVTSKKIYGAKMIHLQD